MRSFLCLALLAASLALVGGEAVSARAAASASAVVTYNVHYGNDPLQTLDVYKPAAAGTGRPLVVLVHGGSWNSGSKQDPNIVLVAQTFVAAGMVVFSIDYRLASAKVSGVPMQIQDVKQATWWVKAHASAYGANPARVGLFGSSAGAGLAAVAGEAMNVTAAGAVKAVTTLSGFMDIPRLLPPGTIGIGPLAEFVGCEGTPCQLPLEQAGSPQYYVARSCPAFHVLHSANEPLPLAQAQNLVNSLKALGCKTQFTIVPGALHGMKYWPAVSGTVTSYFVAQL